jgi:hypothetical protein
MHEPNYKGHFAILVLHSEKEGIFQKIEIETTFSEKHVIEEEIRISVGDKVGSFTGANAALGTLFLRFDSREELAEALETQSKWLSIIVS